MVKYCDVIGCTCGASDQSCCSIWVMSMAIFATLSTKGWGVGSSEEEEFHWSIHIITGEHLPRTRLAH